MVWFVSPFFGYNRCFIPLFLLSEEKKVEVYENTCFKRCKKNIRRGVHHQGRCDLEHFTYYYHESITSCTEECIESKNYCFDW